jgi:hypothetical protein
VIDIAWDNMEQVNHPQHYCSHNSGIEAIQVTENLPFNTGNAIKYLWRKELKGKREEDVQKAIWYLKREIQRQIDNKAYVDLLNKYIRHNPDDKVAQIVYLIASTPYVYFPNSAPERYEEAIKMIMDLK